MTSCVTSLWLRPARVGAAQPRRRTLADGILPSTRCVSAALRHPACACFHSPALGAWSAPPSATLDSLEGERPREPRVTFGFASSRASCGARLRRRPAWVGAAQPRGRTLADGILPSTRSTPTSLSASCLRSSAYAGSRGVVSPSLVHPRTLWRASVPGGRASPRAARDAGASPGEASVLVDGVASFAKLLRPRLFSGHGVGPRHRRKVGEEVGP